MRLGWMDSGTDNHTETPPRMPPLACASAPQPSPAAGGVPRRVCRLPRALCRPSPVPAAFPVRQLRPRRPGERDGSESRVWATKHGEQRGHAAVTAPRWVSWRGMAPAAT